MFTYIESTRVMSAGACAARAGAAGRGTTLLALHRAPPGYESHHFRQKTTLYKSCGNDSRNYTWGKRARITRRGDTKHVRFHRRVTRECLACLDTPTNGPSRGYSSPIFGAGAPFLWEIVANS